jgi:O-antigen/teichoic acid export membrane protein
MKFTAVSRIGKRLSAFVGGQSAVQSLNAASGLLLLRLMSKPDFAIYAIALGIQGMIAILTDVGFGSAIAGLVGTRYKDKAVLGSYIRTASHIRQVLLMIVAGAAVVLVVVFRNIEIESHGRKDLALLALAVLITMQFQAWASYYEIPLILHNKLVSYYSPQIAAAALRIVSSVALYYVHWVSAATVIGANTLGIVAMGVSYRFLARPLIEVPRKASKAHSREMVRFLLPTLPGTVYFALQGQISLFLIAVFGHVGQLAEVAAATRIGQLFLLLNSSNGILVAPFFAKTPRSLFSRRYGYAMCCVGGIALLMAASVKLCPAAYLLLLGAKYSNLTTQVQLVVYASAIAYFTGAMWYIAMARKWVFWWSGSMPAILLTLIQIVCVVFLPMNTSEGVLKMNIYTALGLLTVQICHVIQGFSVHAKAEASAAMAS